jgi:hypothetical protein
MNWSNGVCGIGGGGGWLFPRKRDRRVFACKSWGAAGASTVGVCWDIPPPTLSSLLSSAAGSKFCGGCGSADTSGRASLDRWPRPSLATKSAKLPSAGCASGTRASSAVVSPMSISTSSVSVTPVATGAAGCGPAFAARLSSLCCCFIHPFSGPRKGATM